jgi:hypothetical protein
MTSESKPLFSALGSGLTPRLVIAVIACAGLWATVGWALN